MDPIRLNPRAAKRFISDYSEAENLHGCYTCGTCTSSCPVGMATGRLRPHELVYHARLGRYEELLAMRAVWFCIGCNRCSHICPMRVSPAALLRSLRREARAREVVGPEFLQQRQALLDLLPRILWHAASALLKGQAPEVAHCWDDWCRTPWPQSEPPLIHLGLDSAANADLRAELQQIGGVATALSVCLTCRECSSACPVCCEPAFFEPVRIFRLANLGQIGELLRSAALWVCLDCRSCIPACRQGVQGALMIHRLQELARREGIVAKDFFVQWQQTRSDVFGCLVGEIGRLLDADAAWRSHVRPHLPAIDPYEPEPWPC